jgi:1,2-diacylglycerol 3-beta-galactosyltransferase
VRFGGARPFASRELLDPEEYQPTGACSGQCCEESFEAIRAAEEHDQGAKRDPEPPISAARSQDHPVTDPAGRPPLIDAPHQPSVAGGDYANHAMLPPGQILAVSRGSLESFGRMQESGGMKTLDLVFFDAGGGHRSAANALREVAQREQRPWDMRLMNLQELLDELDVFRKVTGIRLQDLYNLMLRRGWTLGSPTLMKFMHGIIHLYHPRQVDLLERHWRDDRPDMVVSVIPNFNRALFEAKQRSMPHAPLVTILTDFADYPPHFWIERQQQYFVCGTDRAFEQAREMGHPRERVFRVSGMILNPRFYEPVVLDREWEREALGLDPSLPTAMMMFGGEGSPAMIAIAEALNSSGLDLQIIAICGKGRRIEEALRAIPRRVPIHVEGFTREVPRFMRLSDFFIGKPGPGSISEAIEMGLPVIIERNMWTLPQERYNADWVEEQGAGIALSSFKRQVVDAARRMVDLRVRCEFVRRIMALRNRAVFEIPEILERILESGKP